LCAMVVLLVLQRAGPRQALIPVILISV